MCEKEKQQENNEIDTINFSMNNERTTDAAAAHGLQMEAARVQIELVEMLCGVREQKNRRASIDSSFSRHSDSSKIGDLQTKCAKPTAML